MVGKVLSWMSLPDINDAEFKSLRLVFLVELL
jgi:hypothetical protein